MRPSDALSLVIAAAGSHAAAQTTLSAAPPSTTLTPDGPATGKLGNATVVENNPPGVVYQATFPDTPFFKAAYPDGGNIKGTVVAVANPDGIGVMFKIKWTNLPKAGGPFMYHLHVAPVPENGNCTATLAHLDPFIRGEDPACDKKLPQTCQTGDLSGKYGDIPEGKDKFETSYVDLFSSTVEGLGSFFGNRSIVFHYANKTRVSCANFEKVTSGEGPSHASESVCSSTATAAKPTGSADLNKTGAAPTGASPTGTGTTQIPVAAATGLRATAAAGVIAFAAAIMFML